MHLTDFVRQLRLFLRVVVLIIWTHRAPVEDVLHGLRLGLGLSAKSCQSREELNSVLSQLEPGVLGRNKVDDLMAMRRLHIMRHLFEFKLVT